MVEFIKLICRLVITFSVFYRKFFQTQHHNDVIHLKVCIFYFWHLGLKCTRNWFLCTAWGRNSTDFFSCKKSIFINSEVPSPEFWSCRGVSCRLCAQELHCLLLFCGVCLCAPASSSQQSNRRCFTVIRDTRKKTFPVFLLLHKKTFAFMNTEIFFQVWRRRGRGRGGNSKNSNIMAAGL